MARIDTDELWSVLDRRGPRPANGWQLYTLGLFHRRRLRFGGVGWRIGHHLKWVGDHFLSFLSVEPIDQVPRSKEHELRKLGRYTQMGRAALRTGHQGGWSLDEDDVHGFWELETASPGAAFRLVGALDEFVASVRGPRRRAALPPALPWPKTARARAAALRTFCTSVRREKLAADRLDDFGYQRTSRFRVHGTEWRLLRAVACRRESTIVHGQLWSTGAPPTAAERRRLRAALRELGFRSRWVELTGEQPFLTIDDELPPGGRQLEVALRRLDTLDRRKLKLGATILPPGATPSDG